MTKYREQEKFLNVAVPPAVHAAVLVASTENLTNVASYVRMAVIRQLRHDGITIGTGVMEKTA
jgi:hypothetical protein